MHIYAQSSIVKRQQIITQHSQNFMNCAQIVLNESPQSILQSFLVVSTIKDKFIASTHYVIRSPPNSPNRLSPLPTRWEKHWPPNYSIHIQCSSAFIPRSYLCLCSDIILLRNLNCPLTWYTPFIALYSSLFISILGQSEMFWVLIHLILSPVVLPRPYNKKMQGFLSFL